KDTVALISTNPYRLIEDVKGIGFLTADKMAHSLGIDLRSDFRIRAGLVYTLHENSEKNGNTLLPFRTLAEETARLLAIEAEDELIEKNVADLLLNHKIKELDYEGERAIMSSALYKAEYSCAVKLCRMIEATNRALPDCEDEIAEFERIERVTFHEEQRSAIVSAIRNGVSVITGGPGTGKTTIVRCILRLLTAHGMSVKLMAPTGRASKRLSESTGADASTIHRALMSCDDEEYSGLNSDAIIVDEFSMVDVSLLSDLLSSVRDDAKLIIVGDADQLPSVGAGNALADIINCGIIPVTKLTRIYRQDESSKIIVNAHKINAGEVPDFRNGGKDFFFIRSESAMNSANVTVDLVTRRLPGYLNCDPTRIQVLCPMKSGEAGCNNLNRMLRSSILGNPDREIIVGDYAFASGDKVMHVVNNYNLEWTKNYSSGTGVFNGDAGTVLEVRTDSGEILVEFEDGRKVTYASDDRNQLMPAYAITVHKSQGSEYEGVVIPVSGGHPMIMTRNLLYTAITRAKNLVVLVGKEEAIARMVNNNFIKERYSMLKTFIIEAERKISLLYGN
ncbi:MAG: AAA family ATPase, partial [Clostridia bacterium]|nr:AAA family ATPase [Clostridia bacterium]